MNLEPLSITEELQKFAKHLHPEKNKHIIFSGIFGIGKTYFIKEFFEQQKERYLGIRLNPVNYSVANNEDIFEYIKYDVAFELFKKFPLEEYSKSEKILNREVFVKKSFKTILWDLAKNGAKVHQSIEAIFSIVETLYDKMEEADKLTPQSHIENFFADLKKKTGPYESDNISLLIRELISEAKANEGMKSVLIIDDLDRIDPEHIFRILNVFSAQVDKENSGKHKLGFDKIILICDIQNIRNIFHHRYGSDTDFSGYVDKFYSTEIFEYNFKRIISRKLHKIFDKIEYGNDRASHTFTNFQDITYFLYFTIIKFFEVGALSTRSFVNFLSKPFELEDYYVQIQHKTHPPLQSFFIFDFLEKLCGGETELRLALKKSAQRYPRVEVHKFGIRSFQDLVVLIDIEENQMTARSENYVYKNKEQDFSMIYRVKHYGHGIQGEYVALTPFLEHLDVDNPEVASTYVKQYIPIFDVMLKGYRVKCNQDIKFFD